MTIFFAWVDKKEMFDSRLHLRHDLTLISFEISHNEGEAALLKIVASNFCKPKSFCCFLSYQDHGNAELVPLFKGELCHFPIKSKNYLWKLEFRAIVDTESLGNFFQQKDHFAQNYPSYPLQISADDFTELAKSQTLTKNLSTQTSLYEFNRTTGQVCCCDVFEGNKMFTPKTVFNESVNVRFTELPYCGVDLTLTADWKQRDSGEVDVGSVLARAFPEKIINTFTPHHFKITFPKPGLKLGKRYGKSACRVVESSLAVIDPPQTGLLDVYPMCSPPLWQYDIDEGAPQQLTFKRHWFVSTVTVEWSYSQRRCEMIHLTLHNRVQAPSTRPRKKVSLTLKDLPETSHGSFFKTEKGVNTLLFALDYARCFLASSSRCIEVEFKVPFDEGIGLSTEVCVDLSPVLKLKSPVKAKITHYRLMKKGVQGYAFVRCALAIGMKDLPPKQETSYAEDSYVDHEIRGMPHQILVDKVAQKLKPKGIIDTSLLHTTALVEQIGRASCRERVSSPV